MVGMLLTPAVKSYISHLKGAGLTTYYDAKAGTAEAKDGEIVAFKAVQKGKGAPWIVRYANSDQVKWN